MVVSKVGNPAAAAAILDAPPGRLDIADSPDVPIDDGEIDVGQRSADRPAGAVGRAAIDQRDVLLVFRRRQLVANLFVQRLVVPVEVFRQLR